MPWRLSVAKKTKILLIIAVALAVVLCVSIFLIHRYNTTSHSDRYSDSKRSQMHRLMDDIIHQRSNDWDGLTTVAVIQDAYGELGGGSTVYTVKLYVVDESAMTAAGHTLDKLWQMAPNQADAAAASGIMIHAGTAKIELESRTDRVLRFQLEALM